MTGLAAERKPAVENDPVTTPLDGLLDNLLAAGKLLDKGENGGRLGAVEALNAIFAFLHSIPGTVDHRRPIVALLNALASLDEGGRPAMLKPKAGGPGRRPTSAAHNCAKGTVVATAERLQSAGMGANESYRRVAKTCNQAGFAPGRGRNPTVTAQTVRCWREEIEADFERKFDAAKTFDRLKQSWAAMPTGPKGASGAAALQRALLEALHRSLVQTFPPRSRENN
jgi:hypothetical protein